MVNDVEGANSREVQVLQQYLNEFGQQVEVLVRQLELIEARRVESLAAIETLTALTENSGEPVLLQLGGGVSLRAQIIDPQKMLVNIGSDITIEQNNQQAIEFLQDRVKEMEALGKKIQESIQQIQVQANEVARRIESAYQKAQSQAGY